MLLNPNIRAVLFDLDGTLIDSAPDLGAAADKMRTDRGMAALPFVDYRPMAGAGARGMLGVALGITPEHADFATLREEFFLNYERAMLVRSVIFEGVPNLLEMLAATKLPWGIVTNKISRFTLPLTASLPMFASASAIVCGDTTPYSKPHPEPLLEAARRLGVAPEHCVYVGDDERDMIAGRAAGMRTVIAGYGYLGAKNNIAQWDADATISSPMALLAWLSVECPDSTLSPAS